MDAIGFQGALMRLQRWISSSIPFAAVALVSAAPMATAQQGMQLFEWSGQVDREVQIVMRGTDVRTQNIGASEPGRARARALTALPRQDGRLTLQVASGRGNVNVVQQPTSQNGYTAIIRVEDPGNGAATYRILGYWERYANGNDGRRDRDRDRGRGHDRDDGYNGRGNNGVNGSGRPNESMFHWTGNVDGELEIRIQNGRVSYRTVSGAQPTSIRSNNGFMNVPRTDASVGVVRNQGRGSVSVIQQPSPRNGYATVIRVRDPEGGFGYYDFDLMWQ
jgi:hypothetical protein